MYTIFAGTNSWTEWRTTAGALLNGDGWGDGPDVPAYEAAFAKRVGVACAVSFGAGRHALYAILEALGIGAGDEVLIPAFTCVVVPNAVLYRGARPVYVDIDPLTFNIDVECAARAITPRTRAIIAQHTFGLPCDLDALLAMPTRGIVVIEDCAHALGASLNGRPVGSIAPVAYFSTDHTKMISTVIGGMVTARDAGLGERIREIQRRSIPPSAAQARRIARTFLAEFLLLDPRVARVGSRLFGAGGRMGQWCFYTDELETTRPIRYPYPGRLSQFQARLGLSQLAHLDENLAARRRAAAIYADAMEGDGPESACATRSVEHSWLRYTWLVDDRAAWERWFSDLADLAVWFTSVAHGRNRDLEEVGYVEGSCPNAEFVVQHCVNLSTHARISDPGRLADRLRSGRRRFGVRVPRSNRLAR